MPVIRIDLDPISFRRLTELAVEERRPIAWQAEVMLLRALGCPAPSAFPCVAPKVPKFQRVHHAKEK